MSIPKILHAQFEVHKEKSPDMTSKYAFFAGASAVCAILHKAIESPEDLKAFFPVALGALALEAVEGMGLMPEYEAALAKHKLETEMKEDAPHKRDERK